MPKGKKKEKVPLEPWQEEDAMTLLAHWERWRADHPEESQEKFGADHSIGIQAYVSQLLRGGRPLNIEVAAKFAKGLGCMIVDIAPNLAARFRRDVLPYFDDATARLPKPRDIDFSLDPQPGEEKTSNKQRKGKFHVKDIRSSSEKRTK